MNAELLKRTIQVIGTGDWTWLFRIVVDRNPETQTKTVFQLTPWGTPLSISQPRDSDEVGYIEPGQPGYPALVTRTYTPAPVSLRELFHDTEASVPSIEVSITDPTRRGLRYIEYGQGYRGCALQAYAVNVQALELGACLTVQSTIRNVMAAQAAGKNAGIMLQAEVVNLADGELPRHTIQAWRCDHQFGARRCGFRVTASTPSQHRRCSQTFVDCTAKGDHEVSLGLPRLHPDRMGTFPGALGPRGRS